MRTKTLLFAAAALAAGIASSEAQNVYSQNVVGYVNVVLPGNGQYALVSDPFDDGNGNSLSNIITAPLPGGVANPLGQSKITTFGVPTAGVPNTISKGASGSWNISPSLPPGTGFFVQNGKPGGNAPTLTNTFVGSVVVASGGSITNPIPTGYSLVGPVIPYAGNVANSGAPGGDVNLNYGGSLSSPDTTHRSQITYWNQTTQSPSTVTKGVPGNWNASVPVAVGQAYYIYNPNAPTNMVQNATY